MTGPEHYRRAEEMLEVVERLIDGDNRLRDAPILQAYSAAAQVHATLALAAATALGQDTETDRTNWRLAMRKNGE